MTSSVGALEAQAGGMARLAYSDIGGLRSLRADDPGALERAAEQFESLFVDIWMSSMRDAGRAFSEGNYLSSSAVDMHQEMLDHQWAVHVSESGGVGLKDVLMRQLGGVGAQNQPDADAGTPGGLGPLPERGTFTHAPGTNEATVAARSGGFKSALFEGAESFVAALRPLVEQIAGETGIHPLAVLSQAALETGWGSSMIHDSAGQPSYNLFGIKAHDWEGPTVEVTTLEHQMGRFVRKVENFRAYEGVAEALRDYVRFLGGNGRYEQAMRVAQDPGAFADALQEAGYATDPGYAGKLKALQRQIAGMLGGE